MNLLTEIRSRFEQALRGMTDEVEPFVAMVKPSQDPRFGDFQANCAMPLGKKLGRNPREVAAEIVEALDVADLCDPPEVAGPGFINLRLQDATIGKLTNDLIPDSRLGHTATERPRTIIVDYSSPNVAKPMHVGHLRSTVIGNAICRILSFQGHRVISDNHIGDWGTQFGMIIFGYKHFLDEASFESDAVNELARLYRLVNQLSEYHEAQASLPDLRTRIERQRSEIADATQESSAKDKAAKQQLKKKRAELAALEERASSLQMKVDTVNDNAELKQIADQFPDIAERARRETAKLHEGDEENRNLWDRFLPTCLEALQSVYQRLGIEFDLALGESHYHPMLAEIVDELQQKDLAGESDGAICIFIEGNDAPFIVRKRDGAFTYATTDLATIRYRCEELKADEIVYVVDARQSEHFRLLFAAARQWGYNKPGYRHVSFGTVLGPDRRPLKTRAGDNVGLESLLDEAVSRARQIVDDNDDSKKDGPELDEVERAAVAETVGIGGIKYADLNHNRESDYVFDWDKMLAKTGDTATYIQYAYARICGIFAKGGIDVGELRQTDAAIQTTFAEERALAFQLLRFSEAVDVAAAECRPNILTQYLFETAESFSTFYGRHDVLKESDSALRTSRLLLCDLTGRTLQKGLALLGISISERM